MSVEQIECGGGHCIALLNIGYVMLWGDNEHGQMGNKKRSPVSEPLLQPQFSKQPVLGVFASADTTGVIVEELP